MYRTSETCMWKVTLISLIMAIDRVLFSWRIAYILCLRYAMPMSTILVQAIRRSAVSLELLLRSMQDELPDTAAAVRLSSLEIADAIEEVTGLGSDISAGIRASARAIVEAEEGVKGAGKLITSVVLPSVKSKVPEARGESANVFFLNLCLLVCAHDPCIDSR